MSNFRITYIYMHYTILKFGVILLKEIINFIH